MAGLMLFCKHFSSRNIIWDASQSEVFKPSVTWLCVHRNLQEWQMSPPTSMNDMTKQNNFSQRSKQLSFTETINPELHPKKKLSHESRVTQTGRSCSKFGQKNWLKVQKFCKISRGKVDFYECWWAGIGVSLIVGVFFLVINMCHCHFTRKHFLCS